MRRVLIISFITSICFILIFLFENKNKENLNFFLIKITKYLQIRNQIQKIEIQNNKYISQNYILRAINMTDDAQSYLFNSKDLKEKLSSINEIQDFSFELKKNGNLLIKVIEKEPFMVVIDNSTKKYIDNYGKPLKLSGIDKNNYIELSGEGVLDFISEINKSFSNGKKESHSIEKIIFKHFNSWLVIFKNGKCILSSIKGLDKTLDLFENIRLLDIYKNYSHFDMRVTERIYLSKKSCLV